MPPIRLKLQCLIQRCLKNRFQLWKKSSSNFRNNRNEKTNHKLKRRKSVPMVLSDQTFWVRESFLHSLTRPRLQMTCKCLSLVQKSKLIWRELQVSRTVPRKMNLTTNCLAQLRTECSTRPPFWIRLSGTHASGLPKRNYLMRSSGSESLRSTSAVTATFGQSRLSEVISTSIAARQRAPTTLCLRQRLLWKETCTTCGRSAVIQIWGKNGRQSFTISRLLMSLLTWTPWRATMFTRVQELASLVWLIVISCFNKILSMISQRREWWRRFRGASQTKECQRWRERFVPLLTWWLCVASLALMLTEMMKSTAH